MTSTPVADKLAADEAGVETRPGRTPEAIDVAHLTHRYVTSRRRAKGQSTRPALNDVSFQVHPGEIFGVLGPNGGGKSTLFRILATLQTPNPGRADSANDNTTDAPSEGGARIFGRDVLREAPSVRELLGIVFQQPSLDAKLTARENLRHQGRLYGLGGAELDQRINRWLERFNLIDRADEYTEASPAA